ncbi:hypothetical protein OESDEN_01818 [Oesophagostomum dentatum]|uniref:Uncharacterized protein n=1 Tax=Oesophagostomum dentatum TaxID=61180 RepID=A0A0B1TLU1_OESDE|nr:hypothetical protein OESDEN_01818 [Oesophagostomum dentatum]
MLGYLQVPGRAPNPQHSVFIALPSSFANVNSEIDYEGTTTIYVYEKLLDTAITTSIIVLWPDKMPESRAMRQLPIALEYHLQIGGTLIFFPSPFDYSNVEEKTDPSVSEKDEANSQQPRQLKEFDFASAEVREMRKKEKMTKARRRREEYMPNFYVIQNPEGRCREMNISFKKPTECRRNLTPARGHGPNPAKKDCRSYSPSRSRRQPKDSLKRAARRTVFHQRAA